MTTIDYEKAIKPIYIKSMEANQIYMNDLLVGGKKVKFRNKGDWHEFKQISTSEAVLNDSLFLRFMNSSIVRNSSRNYGYTSRDLIILKFKYGVRCKVDKEEIKVDKHDLRSLYYENGVNYSWEKKNNDGETVRDKPKPIHYKMLMRSTGKAKQGECVFIRDDLFDKAINFLTMGLYDLMANRARANPESVFNLVGLSAYQTLVTATAKGYLQIPLENILILKDKEVFSDGMRAAIVRSEDKENRKKECTVTWKDDVHIKNVVWDGMGIIDESIFPKDMNGFIYCRSHFFKSCLFRGEIQKFFKDYCAENQKDYDSCTTEEVDMFHRKIKLSDVKAIITDQSIKWIKFLDLIGGSYESGYEYYREWMKDRENYFEIVKTGKSSKIGELQLSTYQYNNSLPSVDENVLGRITETAVDYFNRLKASDEEFIQYLKLKSNRVNTNEMIVALVEHNPEIVNSKLFREKKSKELDKLKNSMCQGKIHQHGDNLTIADNPVALLLAAVGDKEPLKNEQCFEVIPDGVQCFTLRFPEGTRLAAFRSPHNSPNNIVHLKNVYPEKMLRYFPNLGQNVIVLNAIKTDTQARLSGQDCDSDSIFVTDQPDMAELARKAYLDYPTIINEVGELNTSEYHFSLKDYANMDSKIADAQKSIGTSTDVAQLALSYYYDEGMTSRELEECFIILSTIGQISIDLAKKIFNINVVKEIRRIKKLPCMSGKKIPEFFASNKKERNKKKFDDYKVEALNCPMDIMARIIKENTEGYPDRGTRLSLRQFLNPETSTKGNKNAVYKIATEAALYNNRIKELKAREDEQKENGIEVDESLSYQLKERELNRFLNMTCGKVTKETVMQLILYATNPKHSDVQSSILNYLYKNHEKLFLNCFIDGKKLEKI